MSCGCGATCTCGCCAGTGVATPVADSNAPGLSAIAYRTGTWATFLESMLARLSSSDYPALTGLKTRSDDDYSIALLDASAVVLDILTFYQERLANESYLRTATQLYSLTQLSRLIGYQPSSGVSASVYLAFTLSSTPGLPLNPTTNAITIPAGTTVQSVPAQGQAAQAFQTSAPILAKPDWNALAVQTDNPWQPRWGEKSMYLAGTSTQLNPGDAFLIVGDERLHNPSNSQWDLRIVASVDTDTVEQRTLITWKEGLGGEGEPAKKNPKFYALRQRAALFGYNAINPLMLTPEVQDALSGAGLLQDPVSWIRGSVISGTFVAYEGVYQQNTDAYAQLGSAIPDAYQMSVGAITGTPDSSSNWIGESSNAVFKPTAAPLVVTTLDWIFGWDGVNQVRLGNEYLVDLDAVYSKLTTGGWLALINPTSETFRTPAGYISLYNISSITYTTRSDYSMSGKVSRVTTDTDYLLTFYYGVTRVTSCLTQSEELDVAEQPLDYPLYGTLIDLEGARDDLSAITAVSVTGKSQIVTLNTGVTLNFTPYDDTSNPVTLNPGDQLTLLQPPPTKFKPDSSIPDWQRQKTTVIIVVADSSGRAGTVSASLSDFTLALAPSSAPQMQELALVSSVSIVNTPVARTRIVLANPLLNCYDRTVTTVNANVGLATGGSPVTELLGNGAAATPNQSFALKQSPLTYTQAVTPTGRASSLQVQVNGADWTLVPTLYNQPPQAQVFTSLNLSNGKAQVIFGDGEEGSTVPTGQNNIIANYRVGIGLANNVGAGSITTLVDRPVGVSGVNNPMAATGGQDPQSVDDIRANAPMSVQTLGRAVSITDYQNFSATFAGIAKASALWIPSGFYRGVFVTVAAAGGSALESGNPTLNNLTAALIAYGNPAIPVYVVSFWETLFGLNAKLKIDPAYSTDAVQAAVAALLQTTYGFANRTFGQGVSGDELAALIQGVAGVTAVNVTAVSVIATSAAGDLGSAGYSVANWQNWIRQPKSLKRPCSGSRTAICPYIPTPMLHCLPNPAEILVISPNPNDVVLGVMS